QLVEVRIDGRQRLADEDRRAALVHPRRERGHAEADPGRDDRHEDDHDDWGPDDAQLPTQIHALTASDPGGMGLLARPSPWRTGDYTAGSRRTRIEVPRRAVARRHRSAR